MIFKPCSGHCPRFEAAKSIVVEYQEVLMSGGRKPGYKKMGYDCPDINGCPHLDRFHRCPIFLAAPDDPNL